MFGKAHLCGALLIQEACSTAAVLVLWIGWLKVALAAKPQATRCLDRNKLVFTSTFRNQLKTSTASAHLTTAHVWVEIYHYPYTHTSRTIFWIDVVMTSETITGTLYLYFRPNDSRPWSTDLRRFWLCAIVWSRTLTPYSINNVYIYICVYTYYVYNKAQCDAVFDSWHKDPNSFEKNSSVPHSYWLKLQQGVWQLIQFQGTMVKPSTGARCPLLARKEPCWVTHHCKWWANNFLHLVVKGENDKRLYLDQWRWTDYEKDECDVMGVASFTEQLSAWTFRSTEFHWNNFQDMFSFLSLSFWLLWKSGYTRHGPGHERILVPALISRSFWSPTCDPRSAILFCTMFAFLHSTSESSKSRWFWWLMFLSKMCLLDLCSHTLLSLPGLQRYDFVGALHSLKCCMHEPPIQQRA